MNPRRLLAASAVAGTAVLALSSPAFAHVSVVAEGTAAKGGYAVVDFRVPNERDNASTVKLEVTFPADHPLASVMPQPVEGWSVVVTKGTLAKPLSVHGKQITEAVTKVTWTASGKGIQPGFIQQFPLSVGALPEDTDSLVFKALQTYDNKEVVRWIEVQADGAEEPEHPAPTLALAAASGDGHHGGGATEAAAKTTTTSASSSDTDSTDTTARVLGVVGIVVGIAGVAYGVLAGRRRTASPEA
ncbi:YcnI family copper-binding membrane protein [Streptomyces acidiscabies]|uniref:Membrane protein n=1 Tax=Streptomyces acidiscabies TaxID=42234 RepID=A0A0L0K1W7_9ACTN|nr:YcnI family protein [Streptomyces acidiscabies]KND31754.1 membrane protein [Streptomyces acidiscabies]